MFKVKSWIVLAASIIGGFLGVSTGNAQNTRCYTLESLQGSYAVVVNYGANVALGLQPETLDGKGNLTRTGINNQPTAGSATGARTVVNVTSTGTYTVNCDSTGTITRIVTRADGTTAPASDDFLITGAIEKHGRLIATLIVDAQRDPSVIVPGGIFVTRTHTMTTTAVRSCIRSFASMTASLLRTRPRPAASTIGRITTLSSSLSSRSFKAPGCPRSTTELRSRHPRAYRRFTVGPSVQRV